MKFVIVWKPDAEGQLAALWTGAHNRVAVTQAAHRIELALETDPAATGEERPPGRRILFDPPLGMVFEVDEPKREVLVLSVGWSGRPA